MRPNVNALFDQFNAEFFEGRVRKVPVILNERLQTSAGRITGVYIRKKDSLNPNPFLKNKMIDWLRPLEIELHSRLFDDVGWDYVADGWERPEFELTLLHEMTHAYLWEHMNQKGHTRAFQTIMNRITGKHTNHRLHSMNVSKWRRMIGYRREAAKKVKTNLVGSFNPFSHNSSKV